MLTDDQLKAMERSHAELEAPHYKAIRENPYYRLQWQIEEMRAEMQPPLSSPSKGEVEPVEHHIVYHHIHSNLSGKQAHSIENNTNQILALKKILNTLLGKRRPMSKY